MFTKIFTGPSKEVSRVAYVCTFFSHLIGPMKHCEYNTYILSVVEDVIYSASFFKQHSSMMVSFLFSLTDCSFMCKIPCRLQCAR